ncbi:MAG: hypothetical protein AAF529_10490 [Pseudomonadota bacterium]
MLRLLKADRTLILSAALSSTLCAMGLLLAWSTAPSADRAAARYGETLATTLARTSSAALLHQDRIALAVIANEIVQYPEVDGVAFHDPTHNILAMSGDNRDTGRFTTAANLDDSLTGYVSVVLDAQAFVQPIPIWRWLATAAVLLLAPLITTLALRLGQRGNRSVPIVSVPDQPAEAQQSFTLVINLHNQLALGRSERQAALQDAVQMLDEVCALHAGLTQPLGDRGLITLFDRNSVSGEQAINAAFLLQALLNAYETQGEFRCYLKLVNCPGAPAELSKLPELSELPDLEPEQAFTLAALTRPQTLLLASSAWQELPDTAKAWTRPFEHPLLEDMDVAGKVHLISALPATEQQTIDAQQRMILGFA